MTNTDTLLLIARIGGERVALRAAGIESVVELETPTPVPQVASHVVGLAPLRSRVLTVIDGRRAIGRAALSADQVLTAVVVTLDGHGYALLVDAVEDVVDAPPPSGLSSGLAPDWARVTLGLVEVDGQALLLVDPAALIAGPMAAAA